jgi:Tfp pilus assembly protein PilF
MSENELPEEVRKQRAIELLNQGQLEAARLLLSELCSDEQSDIEMWSLYSTANGYLGRYEDVVRTCNKALTLDQEYLPALNSLASALAALGRHAEAVVQFANLLRLAPDNPAILNNYGHTLSLVGRMDEARKALEDAVRIQPHYAEAHYNLATLLEQSGQPSDALREYEQAATLKPGLPGLDDRMQRLRDSVM